MTVQDWAGLLQHPEVLLAGSRALPSVGRDRCCLNMNGGIGLCTKKCGEYGDPESRPGALGAEVKKTSRKITVVLLESRSDCTGHNPCGSPSPPADPDKSVTL